MLKRVLLLVGILAGGSASAQMLMLNYGGGGFGTPVTSAYNGVTTGSCAGGNPQNILSVPIGTATADRIVVIGTSIDNSGGTFRSLTSATIGGIAATIDKQSSNNPNVAIFHAAVPTGTTATVGLTVAGTATSCDVYSYSLYNLASATPDSTNNVSGNATSLSTTLNYVAGGVAIGIYGTHGAGGTITWTGLTIDQFGTNSQSHSQSAAHQSNLSTATGATIQASESNAAIVSNLTGASYH